MRQDLELRDNYDLIVIGGGVHGAALAWEAALSGASVCLFEQGDFGAAISANSLKIIHGGLRYLQHFDIARTRSYAREQARLLDWFPHLIQPLPCVMPTYPEWKKGRLAMACGIGLYERLAGRRGMPRGGLLSAQEMRQQLASVWRDGMTGGARWFDAQVYNSERLVLSYALSARAQGADVCNYMQARGLAAADRNLRVTVRDLLDDSEYIVKARHVVNASGADTGVVDADDEPQRYVRAVNLVFPAPLAASAIGLQLPGAGQFEDGRLLFITPWRGTTLAGTWYFPDRADNVITRAELAMCRKDLRDAVPASSWADSDISLVHIGRLPVTDDGVSLLDRPRVTTSSQWPQLTNLVGVKYSNARSVAATLARRLFGKPRRPRVAYGGQFTSWPQYQAGLREQWEATIGSDTVVRLSQNYGSVCGQLFESVSGSRLGPLPGTELFVEEIDHACAHEFAHTLADVLIRRSGLGGVQQPSSDTVTQCAQRLAERYNWDDKRIIREKQQLADYYQRLVDA